MSEDNILMIFGLALVVIAGVVLIVGVYVAFSMKGNSDENTLRGDTKNVTVTSNSQINMNAAFPDRERMDSLFPSRQSIMRVRALFGRSSGAPARTPISSEIDSVEKA